MNASTVLPSSFEGDNYNVAQSCCAVQLVFVFVFIFNGDNLIALI